MIQIIFLFFGILAVIYLIIITKPLHENKKNITKLLHENKKNITLMSMSNINIYPTEIQPTNLNKKRILWKNNKKRKQKRKT